MRTTTVVILRSSTCEGAVRYQIFSIACVDREILRAALDAGFSDYEDAVLFRAAGAAGANAIVTHNCKDFIRSTLPVFTPELLLAALHADPG
jgi:hypothetical protein